MITGSSLTLYPGFFNIWGAFEATYIISYNILIYAYYLYGYNLIYFLTLIIKEGVVDLKAVKEDEFWDYEQQVDLEAFSAETLYDKLANQSHTITQNLARQKEEAKALYQKVSWT